MPKVPPKNNEKRKKKHPSIRPCQIHKIYNWKRAKSYKQIGPCPKITQKIQFNPMNRMLNVFKRPTILYFPDCPKKKHKGAALHTFLLFLPTTDLCQLVSISLTEEERTQVMLKSEKKRCQTTRLVTMDENVINRFLLFATEETSIFHNPPSSLDVIQS